MLRIKKGIDNILFFIIIALMFLSVCISIKNNIQRIEYIKILEQSLQEQIQEKEVYMKMLEREEEKIKDIIRFDATENNIKLVKEGITKGKTDLKFNEYEEGKTAKSIKEMLEIADAIMID